MKYFFIKILVFSLLALLANKVIAQDSLPSGNQLEEIRLAVKKEHKNVLEDYKCIKEHLNKTGNTAGVAALDQSRANYDRLYKIIFTDISMNKLKELTRENMEKFTEIETTKLVFEDSGLALCVYFGFHFQELSMAAGNEPL